MIFLSGLVAGFIMSIPPGPATAGLLGPSLRGQKGLALKHLAHFLVADLIVLACVALLWIKLGPFSDVNWLRLLGGIFLIALGVKLLLSSPKNENASRSFWRTILNPGAWFVALGIMSFSSSRGLVDTLWYLGGVQLGSILWFLALIGVLTRIPLRQHILVQRVSIGALFAIGSVVIMTSL